MAEDKKIKVYAFVGPSGTGKSYRAQMVAGEYGINYIIDDGLLVCGNNVVGGVSAKKAPTKIETVKHAIFVQEEERVAMVNAIKKNKVDSIMILGTSDGMVSKIAERLELPPIEKTVYIQDVATKTEMENARRIRITEGKHVIPVPTFEIKKDFSGYILDPLQIFKKGKNKKPYISEKSIIRPTFSYLGNFTISDTVFRQILEHLCEKSHDSIHKVVKMRVENYGEGPYIYMEVIVVYGVNVVDALNDFKKKAISEVAKLTAMQVQKITVVAKGLYMPESMTELNFSNKK